MEWWQIVIPVVIGWALGIGTILLSEVIRAKSERKRVIKILTAEIESNQNHLEGLQDVGKSLSEKR